MVLSFTKRLVVYLERSEVPGVELSVLTRLPGAFSLHRGSLFARLLEAIQLFMTELRRNRRLQYL